MEGTFDFTPLGFAGTFEDPVITDIPRSEIRMNPTEFKIDAAVYLSGAGYNICLDLPDIVVNDFDYNEGQLVTRVTDRLNDFKV